jgi:hypothetical protein
MVASQILNDISQGSADEHQTTLHPCGNGSRIHAIDPACALRPDGHLVAGSQTNGLIRSSLPVGHQDRTAQHGDLYVRLAILDQKLGADGRRSDSAALNGKRPFRIRLNGKGRFASQQFHLPTIGLIPHRDRGVRI